MINIEKTEKFKFLHNAKKLNLIIFILFFIPGTPKDVLTYIIPLTSVKPLHYFVITTVARIPSIITSTFAGSAIDKGQWLEMILIFCYYRGSWQFLGLYLMIKLFLFSLSIKGER